MILALVIVYCLSFGCSTLGLAARPVAPGLPAARTAASNIVALSQESTPSSQQTPAQQNPDSAPQAAPPSQPQNPQAKPPAAKPHRRRKKAGTPDCSTAPTALNVAAGNSAGSTNAASSNAGSSSAVSSNTDSAAQKPCPPPKIVVKNGGSDEPNVELKGGSAAEASYERTTTEQLVKETGENLDKIKELQLTPSQRETVNQINHFLEQSKAAVASGDAERGRNLAMKARLLSDELLKP
ncbi:MAG: hypothetical protein WAM78_11205 [Candidatus Sulfotelmatobacter sp.]